MVPQTDRAQVGKKQCRLSSAAVAEAIHVSKLKPPPARPPPGAADFAVGGLALVIRALAVAASFVLDVSFEAHVGQGQLRCILDLGPSICGSRLNCCCCLPFFRAAPPPARRHPRRRWGRAWPGDTPWHGRRARPPRPSYLVLSKASIRTESHGWYKDELSRFLSRLRRWNVSALLI